MIFPIAKYDRERYEAIKKRDDILIIGVTGGIASGKSTVAGFLKELGSAVIDFDDLAREVVRPGRNAWSKIVEYFGEEILLDNREINRKKLAGIVFPDSEKRKKLEGITHPAIGEAFVKETERLATEEKSAVIQAIVPLLIECGMQELFHAITLVYIPRDMQITRLVQRDGITKEMAISIINAQMPIDEKLTHAHYVIDNSDTLEETMRQVKDLWEKLIKMRGDKGYFPIPRSFTTR